MIRHVLKDGRQVDSIEGHVVKAEENPVLYEIISRMQKEGDEHEPVSTSD